MLSFGGGWFFVVQSEAISVMNKDIKLPGLGSYMARALESGDHRAAFWAVVAMVLLILASDQLVAPAPCLGGQVQDRADGVGHRVDLVGVRLAARGLPVHLAPDARLATADGQALSTPVGRAPISPPWKAVGAKWMRRAVALLFAAWLGFEVLRGSSRPSPRCTAP
jgi:NitT/TauT family transport system permease protein